MSSGYYGVEIDIDDEDSREEIKIFVSEGNPLMLFDSEETAEEHCPGLIMVDL